MNKENGTLSVLVFKFCLDVYVDLEIAKQLKVHITQIYGKADESDLNPVFVYREISAGT